MLLGNFRCNTKTITALALEPIGVTQHVRENVIKENTVPCNDLCLWQSLSACFRKCNKTKKVPQNSQLEPIFDCYRSSFIST